MYEGERVRHDGVKIEFVNLWGTSVRVCFGSYPPGAESNITAELFSDCSHHQEFLSPSQEVANPGELRQGQTFDFMFKNVKRQYDIYLQWE